MTHIDITDHLASPFAPIQMASWRRSSPPAGSMETSEAEAVTVLSDDAGVV